MSLFEIVCISLRSRGQNSQFLTIEFDGDIFRIVSLHVQNQFVFVSFFQFQEHRTVCLLLGGRFKIRSGLNSKLHSGGCIVN